MSSLKKLSGRVLLCIAIIVAALALTAALAAPYIDVRWRTLMRVGSAAPVSFHAAFP